MKYIKVIVDVSQLPDYEVDVLVYQLGEIGFDMFENTPNSHNKSIIKYWYLLPHYLTLILLRYL